MNPFETGRTRHRGDGKAGCLAWSVDEGKPGLGARCADAITDRQPRVSRAVFAYHVTNTLGLRALPIWPDVAKTPGL